VLPESDPRNTIWELLLPEEAKRLPAELVAVDAYLDDERFIAPWRGAVLGRLGRPSVPIVTLLRLLYLTARHASLGSHTCSPQWGGMVADRCGFGGSLDGPFTQVEGPVHGADVPGLPGLPGRPGAWPRPTPT
jgi:hypothetical protein